MGDVVVVVVVVVPFSEMNRPLRQRIFEVKERNVGSFHPFSNTFHALKSAPKMQKAFSCALIKWKPAPAHTRQG